MIMTQLLAAVIVVSLALYAITGGADYGAGVWDLLSRGALKEEQKEVIANAIRPIWEANHIWLVLILVLLFSGFPRAFSAIMVALFIPILLALLGIVLRGSAFVFRAYSTTGSRMQRTCAYVFSVASCFTPFFFGIVLGSLSDDCVLVVGDVSLNGYVRSWLNPFPISVGLFTLALFAYLAATYLTVEAPRQQVRQSFRNRAIVAGVITGCMAMLAFNLTAWYAPGLRYGLLHSQFAGISGVAAGVALIMGIAALFKNRFRFARIMAAICVGAVVVAWAGAQYPYIARPQITIFNSVLSHTIVRDIVFACIAGGLVLFPSLGLLLYIFKDQRRGQAIVSSANDAITGSVESGARSTVS